MINKETDTKDTVEGILEFLDDCLGLKENWSEYTVQVIREDLKIRLNELVKESK